MCQSVPVLFFYYDESTNYKSEFLIQSINLQFSFTVVFEKSLGLNEHFEISALRCQSFVLGITCLGKIRKRKLENICALPVTEAK